MSKKEIALQTHNVVKGQPKKFEVKKSWFEPYCLGNESYSFKKYMKALPETDLVKYLIETDRNERIQEKDEYEKAFASYIKAENIFCIEQLPVFYRWDLYYFGQFYLPRYNTIVEIEQPAYDSSAHGYKSLITKCDTLKCRGFQVVYITRHQIVSGDYKNIVQSIITLWSQEQLLHRR